MWRCFRYRYFQPPPGPGTGTSTGTGTSLVSLRHCIGAAPSRMDSSIAFGAPTRRPGANGAMPTKYVPLVPRPEASTVKDGRAHLKTLATPSRSRPTHDQGSSISCARKPSTVSPFLRRCRARGCGEQPSQPGPWRTFYSSRTSCVCVSVWKAGARRSGLPAMSCELAAPEVHVPALTDCRHVANRWCQPASS